MAVDVRVPSAAPVDPAALAPVLDPATGGCMLPAEAYTSDDVLAWERTHLFAAAWVCVGRAADLAAVGSRRAFAVGDDAVLLVRGEDGRLRGFYNVCQHRAHELAPCTRVDALAGTEASMDGQVERRAGGAAPPGAARQPSERSLRSERGHQRGSIHCPYHGWRYGLDGTLLSTPRFDAPAGFDRSHHGLVPVAVEEWHGWVMVNATGDAPPLDRFLDGLGARVADHEPERLVVGAAHSYELATNWKLIVENYHECFHCPNIHPELCAVSPSASGENALGHDGFWVGGWQDLMPHAVTMSLSGASPTTPLRGLQGVARRRVDYLGLLPNLLLSLHPDYVMTHRIDPIAPDRTTVECQWLFAPEDLDQDDFDPAFAVDFWDLTNRQDWAACEGVQRGVSSRGYRPGPFSRDEDAVAQFTRLVVTAYLSGGWTR